MNNVYQVTMMFLSLKDEEIISDSKASNCNCSNKDMLSEQIIRLSTQIPTMSF
jgi:hypothetical protein